MTVAEFIRWYLLCVVPAYIIGCFLSDYLWKLVRFLYLKNLHRYVAGLMLLILSASLLLWAATQDLRPDGDVQIAWTVTGSGTGDCTTDTAEYGCINSDVESPEDTTFIFSNNDGDTQEWTFTNSPGDCVSINSITLKCRSAWVNMNDDNDRYDIHLEVSGTPTGGTYCFSHNDTACACTEATQSNWNNCSFTDATWDGLSCGDVDNLSGVAVMTDNNTGMPDTTQFRISECEILLDYSNVAPTGFAPRRRYKME